MNILILMAALLALTYAIARRLMPLRSLAGLSALFLAVFTLGGGFNLFWGLFFWSALLLPTLLLGLPSVRMQWLSRPLLRRHCESQWPARFRLRAPASIRYRNWRAASHRGSRETG